ncbi:ATP-binding protein [Streptomyces sp. NPDC050560]|uniref:HAMP domain-containing sensor histidine kinase n=1 Tax=Streptomyces sp. NPDC050560 TaxID=3365630 RepID=UPI00378B0FAA
MARAARRIRALPLRTRLAMLVAAAVAFAVAAVSVVCWFLVRGKLYGEVDADLVNTVGSVRLSDVQGVLGNCTESAPPAQNGPVRTDYYLQVVKSDGGRCVWPGAAGALKVTDDDKDVASGGAPGVRHFRDGTGDDGQPVRVLTTALSVQSLRYGDLALQIALPLNDTRSTLNELALMLLLASGIGVLGAGAAGLGVARAGLRPVDQLTGAVEHVARTEDLTVRIPAEGEDEIARLSRSFNSMTAALASSRDRQARLIADAGHELRTPLTSLRTNIDLLARSEETGRALPPEDRTALLASVRAQMTELAALIGDLQELSRPDVGQHPDRVRVTALHDIVDTALGRARLRATEVSVTADVQPWWVRAEPPALERAIVNILDNAVKFSPVGGTVEVRLAAGVLTVRDHGPGIPPEELPHVFDRFWRSPSARSLPGSGLGLSIVARTVRQSGGEVALRPAEEGTGTVATVRLPGAATPPPGDPSPGGRGGRGGQEGPEGQGGPGGSDAGGQGAG